MARRTTTDQRVMDLSPVGDLPPSSTPGSMSLREFVDTYLIEAPSTSADEYDMEAFSEPIQTTKVDPIYNFHPYDSKKSHSAIAEYVEHYCTQGDVVLDPFCGSGTGMVAGLICRRWVVGTDIDILAGLLSDVKCLPRPWKGYNICHVWTARSTVSQRFTTHTPALVSQPI